MTHGPSFAGEKVCCSACRGALVLETVREVDGVLNLWLRCANACCRIVGLTVTAPAKEATFIGKDLSAS